MRLFTTWPAFLLGGVFVASLALNALHWDSARGATSSGSPQLARDAAPPSTCLPLDHVDLDPQQQRVLREVNQRCSERDDELTAKVQRLENRLRSLLAADELDAAQIQQTIGDLTEQRRLALQNCVESIMEVRRSLRPEQGRALLSACSGKCASEAGSCGE